MSVPGPPNINLLPLASPNTLQYAWEPPTQPNGTISAYKLLLNTGGSNAYSNTSISATKRTYIVGPPEITLVNGVSYEATLQAINENGEGQSAKFLDFQPGNAPTLAPSTVNVFKVGCNSAVVSWAPPAQSVNSTIFWYTIYSFSTNPSDPILSYTANGLTDRSYFIPNLNSNSDYYFQINAVNCPGYSPPAFTSTISFITVFPYQPTMTSNLQFWLDATSITGVSCNSPISTWTDKSSNSFIGYASNGPTYITNSLNSNPIVRFNGTSQLINFGNILNLGSNSLSMFAVSKFRTTANGGIVGKSAAGNLPYRYTFIRDAQTMLCAVQGSGGLAAASFSDSSSNLQLVEMVWNRSSNAAYRNGSFQQGLSAVDSTNFTSAFLFYVGAYQDTNGISPLGGYYFDGDIAEILIYFNPLTPFDRQKTEGYLAWKWGFQTSLPTTNPYYSMIPYSSNTTFTPSLIPGMRLWLDATSITGLSSNAIVASWTDKSSSNYVGYGSNSPRYITNAINSLPVVRFVGTSQQLINFGNVLNIGTSNISIFSVVKYNSTADGNIIGKTNPSIPPRWWMGRLNANQFFFAASSSGGNNANYPETNTTTQLYETTWDRQTINMYRNGTFTANAVLSSVGVDFTSTHPLWVGSYPGLESSLSLTGDVGEILVFYDSLTTDNRQNIEGYLAWKWGIQSSLPSTHPYKNSPP